jgi:hypothetical protein
MENCGLRPSGWKEFGNRTAGAFPAKFFEFRISNLEFLISFASSGDDEDVFDGGEVHGGDDGGGAFEGLDFVFFDFANEDAGGEDAADA